MTLQEDEAYVAEVALWMDKYGDDMEDPERAHMSADSLIEEALELIANGLNNPEMIAIAALRVANADITRWYA